MAFIIQNYSYMLEICFKDHKYKPIFFISGLKQVYPSIICYKDIAIQYKIKNIFITERINRKEYRVAEQWINFINYCILNNQDFNKNVKDIDILEV